MTRAIAVKEVARIHYALVFALLAAAAVLAPRAVSAQELPGTEWRRCTDYAWADYNDCLMESDGFFHRLTCDLSFEGNIVWCSAKYGGAVKDAWN